MILSNSYEQLINLNTTLQPGCANLPSISTLQVNGHALPMICGNNGAGRNETIQVIGRLGSNPTIAALNFGQMGAAIRSLHDIDYFLTAQTDPDQIMNFKVYRLTMDDSIFGFIPAEDEQSRNIYRSVLRNYLAAQINTEQHVVETLRLIEQSRLQLVQQCEAFKLLSEKTQLTSVGA
ncbi:hypothetical protein ACFSVK_18735 [Azorhizophilus paspali]|uniref:hypothetical protein n=1 Tax=Azorhizophilus paspali TaxID=69963 RepID=UPI00363E9207